MSSGYRQNSHPAKGVFRILTSTFEPVVRGHFLDIAADGDKLAAGQIFAVEPNLPQPSDPVPINDFKDVSPSPDQVLLAGEIDGQRFEIELFEASAGLRILVGKSVEGLTLEGTDVWVAEDDDDDTGDPHPGVVP